MCELRIGGFVPFSTVDYPGQLAAVVFCQGCSWRCRYCHNPHLLPARRQAQHTWAEILAFLEKRRGLLDAVVFSGGEPTLQAGLVQALREVRALGYRVGLHSAGVAPSRLAPLLPHVDWLGLDIKAPRHAYPRITGVPGSGEAAFASLELVLKAGVAYELRCTWHPALLSDAELEQLGVELEAMGVEHLALQVCRDLGCLQPLPKVNMARLRAPGVLARSVVVHWRQS